MLSCFGRRANGDTRRTTATVAERQKAHPSRTRGGGGARFHVPVEDRKRQGGLLARGGHDPDARRDSGSRSSGTPPTCGQGSARASGSERGCEGAEVLQPRK